MDLVISSKHSSYARRGNTESCPAARALKAAGFKHVSVDHTGADIEGKYYKFPKGLSNAISAYDSGEAFKLGTYRIVGLKAPVKTKAKSK